MLRRHKLYAVSLTCLAAMRQTTPVILESVLGGEDEVAMDTRHELETLVRFAEVMQAEGRDEK